MTSTYSVHWKHSVSGPDTAGSDPLATGVEAALTKSAAGTWGQDASTDAADFRALMFECLILAGHLQGLPANADGSPALGAVDHPSYPDADHAALGRGLLDPFVFLGEMRWQGQNVPADVMASFSTLDGEAPTAGGGEAGALPIIVGYVVAAAILAVAYCYLGQKTAEVVDREFARENTTKSQAAAMMQQHAALVALVKAHLDAEQAQGKSLPLNDAEKAALQALTNGMATLGQAVAHPPSETPLASSFPSGGQATATLLGWAAIAAGAWLAYKFIVKG